MVRDYDGPVAAMEAVLDTSLSDCVSVMHRNINLGKSTGVPVLKITGVDSNTDDNEDSDDESKDEDDVEVGPRKVTQYKEFDVDSAKDENPNDVGKNPDKNLPLEAPSKMTILATVARRLLVVIASP